MRRVDPSLQLLAPLCARRGRRAHRNARLDVDRDLRDQRARERRDRRRALRLHRQLGRALVRSHQLRRRRRVGRRRALDARAGKARDHAAPLRAFFAITRSATSASLALAAAVGAAYALVVGLPLMRLSGLAAGIATFGVLEITHNVLRYWEKIGPGLNTFSAVPETTGLLQASLGAALAVVVAFAYRRSRFGRLLERDARGRGRGTRGRGVRVPPAAGRLRALGRSRRLRRRAATSTCSP